MSEHGPSGKSPHAFMVEALGVQSRLLAQRRALITAALMGDRMAMNEGLGFFANDVDRYFDSRALEEPIAPPELRTWRK
jgi:hypothetical protein